MKSDIALSIQESITVILIRKLMDCFDDLEALSSIQTTNEFRVIKNLENSLFENICSQPPTRSSDYEIAVKLWNDLKSETETLNKKHAHLLSEIIKKFKVSTPDNFLLLGSILKHEKRIYLKADPDLRASLKQYVTKANEIIKNFRVNLLDFQASDCIDCFFQNADALEKTELKFTPITPSAPTIYLDLNAAAYILANKNIKQQYTDASKRNKVSFVYSSYMLEDIIISNPLFISELIEEIQDPTQNHMTAEYGEITFVTEDIYETLKRATSLRNMTRYFEHHKLVTTIRHYHDHPEFRRGEKFYNIIKNDPMAIFSTDNTHKNTEEINYLIWKFTGKEFIHELINTGKIHLKSTKDRKQAIEELLELCDFINFQTEAVKLNNSSKIASSFRDNMHILHASVANYFVSDDEKLRNRATFIYKLLGIKTEIISSKSLSEKFNYITGTRLQ